LNKAQIEAKQLSAVAVSMGPGSYTGLRIGISSAKGLCYANDLPLIAVNSLEVLAAAYSPQDDDILISMFDARRMEVYALVLNAQKEVLQATEAVIVTPDSFQEFQSQGRLVFFGNGAKKCKDVIPLTNSLFVEELQFPSARNMVALATAKFEANSTEDVAYFEPFYLKDFHTNTPKR
jgi:tRNA threonylcarbamoyladenosine biosynthesis protein TsaB